MSISKTTRFTVFIALQAILFILYWETLGTTFAGVAFYLYIGTFPAIMAILVFISPSAKGGLRSLAVSKDMVFFLSALFVWVYIFALVKQSVPYIFSTLYYPVIIEEMNFRYVITKYLSELTTPARAVGIQALLYALLYSGYLFMEPGAYPGLYAPLFIIDMISIGLVYGVIYYFRKNIYLDMTLHLSLWLFAAIVPPGLAWIPYTMAPT